jgi:hypothetical protein
VLGFELAIGWYRLTTAGIGLTGLKRHVTIITIFPKILRQQTVSTTFHTCSYRPIFAHSTFSYNVIGKPATTEKHSKTKRKATKDAVLSIFSIRLLPRCHL